MEKPTLAGGLFFWLPLKKFLAMGRKQVLVFLLFCISSFIGRSQTSPAGYSAQWQTVDSLVTQKGLTKSALAIVNRLYATARREKNQPQAIKALVYRLHLEEKTSDVGLVGSIRELESAVDSSSQPARSVLQNILAGLYQRYLFANYSSFSGRTSVSHATNADFTTWSGDEMRRRIATLYLGSLKEERLLAATSLASYSAVVISGNVSQLRPTLFDLLAHTALNYFKTAAPGTVDPINAFEMDDSLVFADAADFAQHHFSTPDTLAPHYQALVLFQRLVRLHMADNRPDALVDLEIERLVFANTVAVADNKEALYRLALDRLTTRYGELPAAAQAWYLQAQQYVMDANASAGPQDTTGFLRAKAICERVLEETDSSQGKANCSVLLNSIERQQVFLQMERINIPHQPIAALVNWQNCNRFYVRVYRLDTGIESYQVRVFDSVFWEGLFARPVYRSWGQSLPGTGDLRLHRAEMAIGSLPPGYYALVISTDSSWSGQHGSKGIGLFAVSNIAYINQGANYYVLNRETGHPLAGASIQVWDRVYTRDGNHLKKAKSYTADGEGHFVLGAQPNNPGGAQLLEISIPGDRLDPIDGNVYARFYSADTAQAVTDERTYEEAQAHTYLFTDRRIYRPGQTVYFKGITLTKDRETHRSKTLADLASTLTLFDANGMPADTLRVTTNAFGSFHGSFTLPVGQLNGRFRIFDPGRGGGAYFVVEEYKRPRFFVDYEKQQGNYRAGDSIRISGSAKGYAGNGIDGATVRYRVVRQTRFPYHWMRWRSALPLHDGQVIAHGEMTTDAAGKFGFVFFAAPDRAVPKDQDPEFDYSVSVDVTDIGGETRSASTNVPAAYTSARLSISVPPGGHAVADTFHRIAVSATNLSGEPVAVSVHLSCYPLQTPQRLIRTRFWEAPDRFIYSEREWLDSFPHNEYRRELEKESWVRGEKVWDTTRQINGKAWLGGGTLSPGWYAIEATTMDQSGREVKDVQYVELFDGKTGKPGNPQYEWSADNDITAAPGEVVSTASGSSASNLFVIRTIQRPTGTDFGTGTASGEYSHFLLNGERVFTPWHISEKDQGGFGVLDVFIKDNRRYTQWTLVRVPWTNKELDIRYASFRDKTTPGSAEKWSLTISGHQQEKVSAEVLTAMYDASLDQFVPQQWDKPFPYASLFGKQDWTDWSNFRVENTMGVDYERPKVLHYYKTYDELMNPETVLDRRVMVGAGRFRSMGYRDADLLPDDVLKNTNSSEMLVHSLGIMPADAKVTIRGTSLDAKREVVAPVAAPELVVDPRKDFRETAFFFPDLLTDSAGNVSFSFTMPDAVTSWKWLTLAGTRDAAFGYSERTVVSQKELMVEPNAPRFLREGDKIELPVKVINMTDSELTGQMSLQLTDPTTGQMADGWFVNRQPNQYFTVEAHQSAVVAFPLDIPYQYNRPLTYKVVAEARGYSDGEEATLPVVSNRLLVTESLPLNMPGDGTRHFIFDKLLKSGSSETLNNHALTVEFTANPAWYAVQSLPYMLEHSDECSEQVFSRLYANALASKIANSSPRLQQVFARWRDEDTTQLLSNLEKNQELKTVLLDETPWVLEGKSESQQKKAVAMLFDMGRMSKGLEAAVDKLVSMQLPDGSFPWFSGGPGDRYITQYVVTGIGHLLRLQAVPATSADKMNAIVKGALPWLDGLILKDYTEAKTRADWIGPFAIQYLYMRSLFSDIGIPGDVFPAMNYYRKKLRAGWLQQNRYMQGMIALALYRTGDVQTAKDIIASLKQNAIRDEEKGMYWKGMESGGYYWYNAPVETQSLLIEAFREIGGDAAIDRALKTWLLKQKQTHNWATTTATADACYALLLGGQDWLNAERDVVVKLGDKTVDFPAAGGDAGVGYNKKVFDGPFVNPSMGNITVTMQTKGGAAGVVPGGSPVGSRGGSPAWGAVYWQYFDMLDRIRLPDGGGRPVLNIRKRLFVKRNTDRGPVLDSLADNGTLHPGDQVVVRVELRADRDLEYVHMKDMRAACLEPVDVISGYRWQDGLGYYESTKDVSTDFFFAHLPRGTHVFEYALSVAQAGNFSNGIMSIECMYAPEFSYHSEGIRVNVEAAP
jgi:Bacterial Alpha-2-macroglobulin MG10 domain/Alpha-2-macroglobulin family/MG2 domain